MAVTINGKIWFAGGTVGTTSVLESNGVGGYKWTLKTPVRHSGSQGAHSANCLVCNVRLVWRGVPALFAPRLSYPQVPGTTIWPFYGASGTTIWMFGGLTGGGPSNMNDNMRLHSRAYAYDTATDQWNTGAPSMGDRERFRGCSASGNGKLCVPPPPLVPWAACSEPVGRGHAKDTPHSAPLPAPYSGALCAGLDIGLISGMVWLAARAHAVGTRSAVGTWARTKTQTRAKWPTRLITAPNPGPSFRTSHSASRSESASWLASCAAANLQPLIVLSATLAFSAIAHWMPCPLPAWVR